MAACQSILSIELSNRQLDPFGGDQHTFLQGWQECAVISESNVLCNLLDLVAA